LKVLLNNRISTISTTSTLLADFPLENVLRSDPNEVAKSNGNVLTFNIVTTKDESTTIAGFNTNADTVRVTVTDSGTVVYDEITDISGYTGWADWFDDFDRNLQRKDFWVDFPPQTVSVNVDIVLTAQAGEYCYCGPLRVDRAINIQNPVYGMTENVRTNEVRVDLLDASVYRRQRSSQRVFSGKLMADSEGDAITILQYISKKIGSFPVPWLLVDSRSVETVIFGGVTSASKSYSYFQYDTFNFEIVEEV